MCRLPVGWSPGSCSSPQHGRQDRIWAARGSFRPGHCRGVGRAGTGVGRSAAGGLPASASAPRADRLPFHSVTAEDGPTHRRWLRALPTSPPSQPQEPTLSVAECTGPGAWNHVSPWQKACSLMAKRMGNEDKFFFFFFIQISSTLSKRM